VAVVGAGWSGLACALELVRRGHAVVLFDAAGQAGGRARAVTLPLGDRVCTLDNGQHLLIGAYRETLGLMRAVGVDVGDVLLRLPFEIRYPDGFLLRARRLPAPWHLAAALISARGLDWAARRHCLVWVQHWRRRGWTIADDAPASTLFAAAPAELRRRLWRPLCLAALNVELEQASAQIMLTVLRDSLAADSQSADLLIPRRDLTQVFADPALRALRSQGVDLQLRAPIQRLTKAGTGWRLDSRGNGHDVDDVVLALPPERAADLLASAQQQPLQPAVTVLRSVATSPIATVYLRYPPGTRLDWPAYALLDDPAAARPGQWVFDRGQLDPANAGVFSVVVSAVRNALAQDAAHLAASVATQLTTAFGLPAPLASTVIAEKRATIVPAPGLERPEARLPVPGLFLAGDAAASDYPSTLEGSVRAGLAAARVLSADRRATA
jgi:squalene-associated FAD-dependent desaturase